MVPVPNVQILRVATMRCKNANGRRRRSEHDALALSAAARPDHTTIRSSSACARHNIPSLPLPTAVGGGGVGVGDIALAFRLIFIFIFFFYFPLPLFLRSWLARQFSSQTCWSTATAMVLYCIQKYYYHIQTHHRRRRHHQRVRLHVIIYDIIRHRYIAS